MSNTNFNRPKEISDTTSVFYGIDKGERIDDGCFADTLNMTSAKYPCVATRDQRMKNVAALGVIPGEPVTAMNYEGDIIVACSNGFVLQGNEKIDTVREIRSLVKMGKDVFTFPHGKVFTPGAEGANVRSIICTASDAFTVVPCDSNAAQISIVTGSKPQSPANGTYWADKDNKALYRYGTASGEWVAIASMYVKLSSENDVFGGFVAGDAVTLSCGGAVYECFVYGVSERALILECAYIDISDGEMSVLRDCPTLDFACEHNNRIWGCHYDGDINEIYASKLGDGFNWNCFRGISTDSYAVSVGDSEAFTGCVELGDTIVFFKENCIYSVYGTEPSSFQTVRTECFGVQKGSERSIAKVNGRVFYKSCHGVMMLSEGSLPVCISDSLGRDIWKDAVGGTDGRRYYLSMTDIFGKTEMFVYDIDKGIWHREDVSCDGVFGFLEINNNLLAMGRIKTDEKAFPVIKEIKDRPKKSGGSWMDYFISFVKYTAACFLLSKSKEQLYGYIASELNKSAEEVLAEDVISVLDDLFVIEESYEQVPAYSYLSNERTCNVQLPAGDSFELADEGRFFWKCETGVRGLSYVNFKRLKGIDIQLKLGAGSQCDVSVQYDGRGRWNNVGTVTDEGISTLRIKDRLERCETYRLRLSGFGRAVIYGITEVYEDGGNIGF